MEPIGINEKISYIEAVRNPLSADIGIVKEDGEIWLYDVGNGDEPIRCLDSTYNVVLSHFHPDHIGNISRIKAKGIYLSKETYNHLPKDMKGNGNLHIVTETLKFGNLTIFPIPSSHAKGSLCIEVDEAYTFVGDALYSTAKNNIPVYNAQKLKDEIALLRSLRSPYLLVSHFKGLVRNKDEVIEELERIYSRRTKNSSEISME